MTERHFEPQLPRIPEGGLPGARIARWASGWTLIVLLTLGVVCIPPLFLLETHMTVTGSGILEPARIWPVRAPVSAWVRDVQVRTGDTVSMGDVLLSLDSYEYERSLQQMEARYRELTVDMTRTVAAGPLDVEEQRQRMAEAAARVTRARAHLRSRMVEHGRGYEVASFLQDFVPGYHVDLDIAVSEVQSAEAELGVQSIRTQRLALDSLSWIRQSTERDRVRQELEAMRERVAGLIIKAPGAGVVLTDDLERLGGALAREGDVLIEIGETSAWRVALRMPERDIHRVLVGDRVRVEIPALSPEWRVLVDGRVVFVSQAARSEGGVDRGEAFAPAAYRVIVTLDSAQVNAIGPEKLRRGYQVRGTIITMSGTPLAFLVARLRSTRKQP